MKRRDFLKHSALASTACMIPSFLAGFEPGRQYASRSQKILIVIQLSGGNDGLNTVVPYRNDLYYRYRPSLAVPEQEVLRLDDELGLNPAMAALRELYEEGSVSVLNSVGYPNPDRSHFRSMDIWHSAGPSDEYWTTGWLGRYLDSDCQSCASPHHALEVDDSLSLALKGNTRSGFAMSEARQLAGLSRNGLLGDLGEAYRSSSHDHDENVAYLYKTLINTQSSADYLLRQSKVSRASGDYPSTAFGRDLRQIAELITADTDTRIYYAGLTGFDTHANQKGRQERLLQQYAEGMAALVSDLKKHNLFQDTLILTFSEFGRRVEQNGSRGTDHGTANNLFLIGGRLQQAGFYNAAPDLSHLENGDLIYDLDFRRVYATVLERWLEADAPAILGGQFEALPLL